METTINLPDDLQTQLGEIAQADGRTVPDLIREATERYLAHRHLDDLTRRGATRSRDLGLGPDDLPRLIAETRREQLLSGSVTYY